VFVSHSPSPTAEEIGGEDDNGVVPVTLFCPTVSLQFGVFL
jgi:hypothetical protein